MVGYYTFYKAINATEFSMLYVGKSNKSLNYCKKNIFFS